MRAAWYALAFVVVAPIITAAVEHSADRGRRAGCLVQPAAHARPAERRGPAAVPLVRRLSVTGFAHDQTRPRQSTPSPVADWIAHSRVIGVCCV